MYINEHVESRKSEDPIGDAQLSRGKADSDMLEEGRPKVEPKSSDKTVKDEITTEAVPTSNGQTPAEVDTTVNTVTANEAVAEASGSVQSPSDEAVEEELLKYLKEESFTLDVTERQLRTRLEAHFGVPLKHKKTVIRDRIMEFIQVKQEMEETEGKGNESKAEAGEDGSEEEISDEEEEDRPVKKKRRGGGGLTASCLLSEPLQAFLGVETMSRPQVVKALWEYIKANDLQDPANKRKINVDEKLATLFTKPLDMFSMNRQLSRHVKTNDAPAEAADGGDEGAKEKKPKAKRKSEGGGEKAAKRSRALKVDGTAKKPSPFTRPLKVSPELSEWLGGQTEISRPELTKRFWAYAKEKELLDPNKKSMLNCDEALKKLTGEDSFQCFGFAKYFKRHLLGYADQAAE